MYRQVRRFITVVWLVISTVLFAGCGSPPAVGAPAVDAAPDAVEAVSVGRADTGIAADTPTAPETEPLDPLPTGTPPTAEFARFCQTGAWQDWAKATTIGKLTGPFKGALEALGGGTPFVKGTLETMKFVPDQPFHLKQIRAHFSKGSGKVRLRVTRTLGRTYPAAFPKPLQTAEDVIPPIEAEVTGSADQWQTFEVVGAPAYLLPTHHYMLIYEHLAQGPALAIETVPTGEYSRALLFMPTSIEAYGLGDGKETWNYRLEAVGDTFCQWKEPEHWFGRSNPFGTVNSSQVAVADLNGDGQDDVILNAATALPTGTFSIPLAYLGTGKGQFAAATPNSLAQALGASFALFGDIDNDGDTDALTFPYVTRDGDGDGHPVPGDDCDDTDPKVFAGAKEITNGKDDDCDGKVDTGDIATDADSDGLAPKDGDCDDTRSDVSKGKPELPDGRDNDCDGQVDEDFHNRIWTNDGKASFTVVANSGIEAMDPSTAAAFSDANADGKLDVYWGNWLVHYPDHPSVQDRYFTGKGDGTFSDAMQAAGLVLGKPLSCYGVVWCDYNNDGAQDLYVSNYHLYPNQLWQNDGKGAFTDVAPLVGLDKDDIAPPADLKSQGLTAGHSYGADFGDFDNDGDMDVFVCNLAHPRTQPWSDTSVLGLNLGPPGFQFQIVSKQFGIEYDEGDINAAWGDYDNDGDLDLVIAGVYTGHFTRLYRNDGDSGFTDITFEAHAALHQASRVVWWDADRDGDLDLLFASTTEAPHVWLLTNRKGTQRRWVQFELQGTISTRDAVGARLFVQSGEITRMRDVRLGGGHWNVQPPKTLHVGLGDGEVDSVKVRWLTGKTEQFSGASWGKRWLLVEGKGVAAAL
ncbi:MAG: hypothetical protein EXR77_07390 [Myxococcales bacterium]|nr:hypothetical protein [Myxococcales bacterium]